MSETLDSRQLIERLEELEALERSLDPAQDPDASGEGSLDEYEREELEALRELADSGISDWEHGAQLIPDDDFEDYARELAEDMGVVDPDASWPMSYIDWEAAADALRQDYTSVSFQGTDYLVQS